MGPLSELLALLAALCGLISAWVWGSWWVQVLLSAVVMIMVTGHRYWRRRARRWDAAYWARRRLFRPQQERIRAGVVIPPDDDVL